MRVILPCVHTFGSPRDARADWPRARIDLIILMAGLLGLSVLSVYAESESTQSSSTPIEDCSTDTESSTIPSNNLLSVLHFPKTSELTRECRIDRGKKHS